MALDDGWPRIRGQGGHCAAYVLIGAGDGGAELPGYERHYRLAVNLEGQREEGEREVVGLL